MRKALPYVYRVTNSVTDEFYIGYRSKNKLSANEDLWHQYFTSSNAIKQQIKHFGQNAFNVKVLFEFGDSDICYWYEQVLIRENCKNEKCLNVMYIDPDTSENKFAPKKGRKLSEEHKLKLSIAGKNRTPEHRAKLGAANKGKIMSVEIKEKISASSLGHKKSEETKRKMSIAFMGRKQSAEAIERGAAKRRGIALSKEHRQKLSDIGKGRIFTEEHKAAKSKAQSNVWTIEHISGDIIIINTNFRVWLNEHGLKHNFENTLITGEFIDGYRIIHKELSKRAKSISINNKTKQ